MQREDEPSVSEPVIEQVRVVATPPRLIALPTGARVVDDSSRVNTLITDAYGRHAERLRAFAIAAVRDGEAADDLVQDTFLRLVRELQEGREPRNIGGWLYRVCANLIVSRGRRRSVADRMRAFLVRRDLHPSPEEDALTHERDRLLAVALSRLSPDQRVTLLLAARGMGAAEIGLVIRRTPVATRTFLFRARVRLREELAAVGVEGDR